MTCRPVACVLSAVALIGGAEVHASSASVGEGERLYRIHCQACHGESARGDGAMRNRLETPPPDLTTLSRRNHDEFPEDRVHQIIDGREQTFAHGSREMPVWGFTFQTSGLDADQEPLVQEMIDNLSQYLESIQVESPSESE